MHSRFSHHIIYFLYKQFHDSSSYLMTQRTYMESPLSHFNIDTYVRVSGERERERESARGYAMLKCSRAPNLLDQPICHPALSLCRISNSSPREQYHLSDRQTRCSPRDDRQGLTGVSDCSSCGSLKARRVALP